MSDHEKLGYALVELGYYDIPEHLERYMNCEVIGREYDFDTNGELVSGYYIEIKCVERMD